MSDDEQAELLRRIASDTGARRSLDDVAREFGIDLDEMRKEATDGCSTCVDCCHPADESVQIASGTGTPLLPKLVNNWVPGCMSRYPPMTPM